MGEELVTAPDPTGPVTGADVPDDVTELELMRVLSSEHANGYSTHPDPTDHGRVSFLFGMAAAADAIRRFQPYRQQPIFGLLVLRDAAGEDLGTFCIPTHEAFLWWCAELGAQRLPTSTWFDPADAEVVGLRLTTGQARAIGAALKDALRQQGDGMLAEERQQLRLLLSLVDNQVERAAERAGQAG